MTEVVLDTEPVSFCKDDFEEFLATDEVFVDFFNYFLKLPVFSKPIFYNSKTEQFEAVSNEKQKLSKKIKTLYRLKNPLDGRYNNAVSQSIKSFISHDENERFEKELKHAEDIKTSIKLKLMDKDGSIKWIKQHRLPAFIRSETFNEFRLCKLLAQIKRDSEKVSLKIRNKNTVENDNAKVKKTKTDFPEENIVESTHSEVYISKIREENQKNKFSIGGGHVDLSKRWKDKPGIKDKDEKDSVFEEDFSEEEKANLYSIKSVEDFENFKNFIKEKNGEKLLYLWLDIDQSRFNVNENQTLSYLQRLREIYVTGGGNLQLEKQLLSKFKLDCTSQWSINDLQRKQSEIVQPLLLYWAKRFLMSKETYKDNGSTAIVNHTKNPFKKSIPVIPLRPQKLFPLLHVCVLFDIMHFMNYSSLLLIERDVICMEI